MGPFTKKVSIYLFLCIIFALSQNGFGTKVLESKFQEESDIKELDATKIELINIRQLYEEHSFSPRWSPDGKKILFSVGKSGHESIQILNLDGSETKVVFDSYNGAWSPDGKRIVYKRAHSKIAILDLLTDKEFIIYEDIVPRGQLFYNSTETRWKSDNSGIYFVGAILQYGDNYNYDFLDIDNLKWEHSRVDNITRHKLLNYSQKRFQELTGTMIYSATRDESTRDFYSLFRSYFPERYSAYGLGGIWAININKNFPFAIRLEKMADSHHISPDLKQIIYVKSERIYIAEFRNSAESHVKKYEASLGLLDGVKKGDILVYHEGKINPLNNKIVGYNERIVLGTLLVESVSDTKCIVRTLLIKESGGQNIVAVKDEKFGVLKELNPGNIKN